MKKTLLGLLAAASALVLAASPADAQFVAKDANNTNQTICAITQAGQLVFCNYTPLSPTISNPTSTLTLPSATAAYATNQLVANSAVAGSVIVPSFSIANAAGGASIPRLRLSTNDPTATAWGGTTVEVDLWSGPPTFTNGDRGAFAVATGAGSHLGTYVCLMSAEYGDGAYAECSPTPATPLIKLASGSSVYWTLQTLTPTGVTGASGVFTLTAEVAN